MSQLKIYDLMPACKLVQCNNETILFGIPPEIIKATKSLNLPIPTTLVIPDKLFVHHTLQNCTEFPLYDFLFVSGGLSQNKKLRIIGNKKSIKNNQELLRITLFGPSIEELNDLGMDKKWSETLEREFAFFRLKNISGTPYEINDFIESVPFNEHGEVNFNAIHVIRVGYNQYKVTFQDQECLVDLNTTQKQHPPYPIQADSTPNDLCKFGIEILGGANGFTSSGASSSLVIVYNGIYMLVDVMPFLDDHLLARGVAKSQINSVFLSHVHDDHCNLLPLIYSVNKIKLLTTKEIYWMSMYKLSLMLDKPLKEILSYFDLVPLVVGKTLDYYGLKIRPHYTIHTIPTIGAKFTVKHNRQSFSTIITSDNQSLIDIKKMGAESIISQTRVKNLEKIYLEETDLLIADGGEGLIHGTPHDALNSQANRVIFSHLDHLAPEFNAIFSVATAGKRYVILKGDTDYYITRAIEFLLQQFNSIEPVWLSILMGSMQLTRYNTDDVIIKQGAESKNKIYLILTGHCSIVIHDGKKGTLIANKEAGDIFGEMAITTGAGSRNASVVAISPVTLCELSEEVFYALILKEQFKDKLIYQWEMRGLLEKMHFFKSFPSQIIDRLVKYSTLLTFEVGDCPYDEKNPTFNIITEGEIEFHYNDDVTTLSIGDFFGYYGYLPQTNSQYVVKTKASCLVYDKSKITKILDSTPWLHFAIKSYSA